MQKLKRLQTELWKLFSLHSGVTMLCLFRSTQMNHPNINIWCILKPRLCGNKSAEFLVKTTKDYCVFRGIQGTISWKEHIYWKTQTHDDLGLDQNQRHGEHATCWENQTTVDATHLCVNIVTADKSGSNNKTILLNRFENFTGKYQENQLSSTFHHRLNHRPTHCPPSCMPKY